MVKALSTQPWHAEPAPHFSVRSTHNPNFHFDSVAGHYIVLTFFGTASIEKNRKALAHIHSHRAFFDDVRASFFGVSIDPRDEADKRVHDTIPGFRFFWDFDKRISILYRAANDADAGPGLDGVVYRPFTLIIDPMMRVMHYIALNDADTHNRQFDEAVASLPAAYDHAGVAVAAPALILPRIFEPELCRELIGIYEKHGGMDSGFMRDVNGKTVAVLDHRVKRRADYDLDAAPEYSELCGAIRERMKRKIVPEMQRIFYFTISRMERYIISRYDSETSGFFSAHRDNTTKATAHRRFACSINLNAEEYEGGDLRFREFGNQTYRAPTGGAVIFSCSMMHEATFMTKGSRYAFLPFFYDEAASAVRKQNMGSLSTQTVDRNRGEHEYAMTDASPLHDGESSPL